MTALFAFLEEFRHIRGMHIKDFIPPHNTAASWSVSWFRYKSRDRKPGSDTVGFLASRCWERIKNDLDAIETTVIMIRWAGTHLTRSPTLDEFHSALSRLNDQPEPNESFDLPRLRDESLAQQHPKDVAPGHMQEATDPRITLAPADIHCSLEEQAIATPEQFVSAQTCVVKALLESPQSGAKLKRIRDEITNKIARDFADLTLTENRLQGEAVHQSEVSLAQAGIAHKELAFKRFVPPLATSFRGVLHANQLLEIRHLERQKVARRKEISVRCVAGLPSVVAVWKHLAALFHPVRIHLVYVDSNGMELAKSLSNPRIDYFDFLVTGEPGMAFEFNAEIAKYSPILAVTSARQAGYFRETTPEKEIQIDFSPHTSAHEFALAERKRRRLKVIFKPDPCLLTAAPRAEMEPQRVKLVYDPMTIVVPRNLKELPFCTYKVRYSMYAHESWFTSHTTKATVEPLPTLIAIREAFVSAWNHLRIRQNEALKLALEETAYPVYFALAAGLSL